MKHGLMPPGMHPSRCVWWCIACSDRIGLGIGQRFSSVRQQRVLGLVTDEQFDSSEWDGTDLFGQDQFG